jgi:hypothetical protein
LGSTTEKVSEPRHIYSIKTSDPGRGKLDRYDILSSDSERFAERQYPLGLQKSGGIESQVRRVRISIPNHSR